MSTSAAARLQWAQMHQSYDWAMAERDPRVTGWPLMSSPWPTLLLVLLYLVCIKIGLRLMQDRPAFSLYVPVQLYNVAMVAVNAHIARELGLCLLQMRGAGGPTPGWGCAEVDYTARPLPLRVAAALWWFYASKACEFFDTVSMVLRKKTRQLSFLHLYHHATMFPIWWLGVAYVAGGNSMIAIINAMVHVIMYTYYFLARLGPRCKKYLWWKRHLTSLQIAQFFVALGHAVYAMCEVWHNRCRFPLWMGACNVGYMLSMIALFSLFYRDTYTSPAHKKGV